MNEVKIEFDPEFKEFLGPENTLEGEIIDIGLSELEAELQSDSNRSDANEETNS
jgi:hypothetical protein